jgi:hypothetical protein
MKLSKASSQKQPNSFSQNTKDHLHFLGSYRLPQLGFRLLARSDQAEGSQGGSLGRSILDLWRGANLHSVFFVELETDPPVGARLSLEQYLKGCVSPGARFPAANAFLLSPYRQDPMAGWFKLLESG